MHLSRSSVGLLLGIVLLSASARHATADALERMGLEKLKATHDKIEALEKERRTVTLKSGYDDVRTLLHVHSAFSHDSRGTLEQIIPAAKSVGVRVIMFNEHPAAHYDYVNDGHRGMKDGVLVIPGAETGGYLAFPKKSIQKDAPQDKQEFATAVRDTDGLIFLCHLEERMNWEIDGLTGNEIYNTHADFKDEPKLLSALRSPLGMLQMIPAVKQYPQEVFGALLDYPADYLRRWDQLCQKGRHTGVSANDAHQNQAFRGKLTEDGKVQLEGGLGEKLTKLDPDKIVPLKLLLLGKKPGDLIFELDMDPYARSFHHVSTHLLLKEVTEEAVYDALKQSRAYVAFDWLADPTGFVYRADRGSENWPIGSDVPLGKDLHLKAEAPLAATFKLLRNGEVLLQQDGSSIDAPVDKAGIYRVEVWLTLAGEPRPWILTNPIYVKGE